MEKKEEFLEKFKTAIASTAKSISKLVENSTSEFESEPTCIPLATFKA